MLDGSTRARRQSIGVPSVHCASREGESVYVFVTVKRRVYESDRKGILGILGIRRGCLARCSVRVGGYVVQAIQAARGDALSKNTTGETSESVFTVASLL